ncbi:hypothetical protein HDU87_007619 [Geranomyces variabilis]|uniref:Uncharacterized protein n=1 Tax=Geranomyces variabilis TaxID=109894 RepID=A0AAD5XKC2_9FUNG|nr:hypothetical protein HDU87_007619 [Geranomyces variabilis]
MLEGQKTVLNLDATSTAAKTSAAARDPPGSICVVVDLTSENEDDRQCVASSSALEILPSRARENEAAAAAAAESASVRDMEANICYVLDSDHDDDHGSGKRRAPLSSGP